jgi:hypothetical protein
MTDGPGDPERIELHASIELRDSVGPAPAALLTPPEGDVQPLPAGETRRRARARTA